MLIDDKVKGVLRYGVFLNKAKPTVYYIKVSKFFRRKGLGTLLLNTWEKDMITKLDGTVVKCRGGMQKLYMYNDYTNLNTRLLDEYNMDLNIFYNEVPEIEHIIDEIDMNKLHVIIDKASIIIENSKEKKDLVFNMDNINKFIETSVKLILAKIEEIQV